MRAATDSVADPQVLSLPAASAGASTAAQGSNRRAGNNGQGAGPKRARPSPTRHGSRLLNAPPPSPFQSDACQHITPPPPTSTLDTSHLPPPAPPRPPSAHARATRANSRAASRAGSMPPPNASGGGGSGSVGGVVGRIKLWSGSVSGSLEDALLKAVEEASQELLPSVAPSIPAPPTRTLSQRPTLPSLLRPSASLPLPLTIPDISADVFATYAAGPFDSLELPAAAIDADLAMLAQDAPAAAPGMTAPTVAAGAAMAFAQPPSHLNLAPAGPMSESGSEGKGGAAGGEGPGDMVGVMRADVTAVVGGEAGVPESVVHAQSPIMQARRAAQQAALFAMSPPPPPPPEIAKLTTNTKPKGSSPNQQTSPMQGKAPMQTSPPTQQPTLKAAGAAVPLAGGGAGPMLAAAQGVPLPASQLLAGPPAAAAGPAGDVGRGSKRRRRASEGASALWAELGSGSGEDEDMLGGMGGGMGGGVSGLGGMSGMGGMGGEGLNDHELSSGMVDDGGGGAEGGGPAMDAYQLWAETVSIMQAARVPIPPHMQQPPPGGRGAKAPVPPTARDLTMHLPEHQQKDAMTRIRREKNRRAASKCRARKVQGIEQTETRLKTLLDANRELKAQLDALQHLFKQEVQMRRASQMVFQAHWLGDANTTERLRAILPEHITSPTDLIGALENGTIDIDALIQRFHTLYGPTAPQPPPAPLPSTHAPHTQTLPPLFTHTAAAATGTATAAAHTGLGAGSHTIGMGVGQVVLKKEPSEADPDVLLFGQPTAAAAAVAVQRELAGMAVPLASELTTSSGQLLGYGAQGAAGVSAKGGVQQEPANTARRGDASARRVSFGGSGGGGAAVAGGAVGRPPRPPVELLASYDGDMRSGSSMGARLATGARMGDATAAARAPMAQAQHAMVGALPQHNSHGGAGDAASHLAAHQPHGTQLYLHPSMHLLSAPSSMASLGRHGSIDYWLMQCMSSGSLGLDTLGSTHMQHGATLHGPHASMHATAPAANTHVPQMPGATATHATGAVSSVGASGVAPAQSAAQQGASAMQHGMAGGVVPPMHRTEAVAYPVPHAAQSAMPTYDMTSAQHQALMAAWLVNQADLGAAVLPNTNTNTNTAAHATQPAAHAAVATGAATATLAGAQDAPAAGAAAVAPQPSMRLSASATFPSLSRLVSLGRLLSGDLGFNDQERAALEGTPPIPPPPPPPAVTAPTSAVLAAGVGAGAPASSHGLPVQTQQGRLQAGQGGAGVVRPVASRLRPPGSVIASFPSMESGGLVGTTLPTTGIDGAGGVSAHANTHTHGRAGGVHGVGTSVAQVLGTAHRGIAQSKGAERTKSPAPVSAPLARLQPAQPVGRTTKTKTHTQQTNPAATTAPPPQQQPRQPAAAAASRSQPASGRGEPTNVYRSGGVRLMARGRPGTAMSLEPRVGGGSSGNAPGSAAAGGGRAGPSGVAQGGGQGGPGSGPGTSSHGARGAGRSSRDPRSKRG